MTQIPFKKKVYLKNYLLILMIAAKLYEASGDKKEEKKDAAGPADVKKPLCCARHQNMINVGQGISGEIIKVDAGYCKSYCPRHFYDDPGDLSRPAVAKCKPNTNCRPRTSRMDRISTIRGTRSVEIVETCDCSPAHLCKRDSYLQTFHLGTPYQVEVDVGTCEGWCKKHHCKPLRNASVSVRGPNGEEVYQMIDRCGCAANCYRMDHMETISDFSRIQLTSNMRIADVRPNVQEINVGKCIGACSSNSSHDTCLLRDKKNPHKCFGDLYAENQHCTPVKFRIHDYRTRRGMKREIFQIIQCACV